MRKKCFFIFAIVFVMGLASCGWNKPHTHTEEIIPGVASTCTATGITEGKKCSKCGEILVAQEEIAALGHSVVHHESQTSTCTSVGWNAYDTCERCDYTTYVEIAAAHTEEIIPGVAPTCTATGITEGKKCSECNEILVAQEDIPALGHIEVSDVKYATTTRDGYENVICSRCNETLKSRVLHRYTSKLKFEYDETTDTYAVCGIDGDSFEKIVIPKYYNGKLVQSISYGALENISFLESLYIPESIIKIEEFAFDCDLAIQNVYYAGNLADWCHIDFESDESNPMKGGGHFFIYEDDDYKELTTIEIPRTIKSVNTYTFTGFEVMESFIFHDEFIGGDSYTFLSNEGPKEIYFDGNLAKWLNAMIGSFDNDCLIYIKNDNDEYENIDNILTGNVLIPEAVTNIKDYILYNYDNITSITIHNAVENVGWGAFSNCDSLDKIYFDGNFTDWLTKVSGEGASDLHCDFTLYVRDENGQYKSFTDIASGDLVLADGITEIRNYAFEYTNIVNLTIPSSVKKIGYYILYEDNKIQNIYFDGTLDMWTAIEFEGTNDNLNGANIYVRNSNGDYQLISEIVEGICVIPDTITELYVSNLIGFTGINTIKLSSNIKFISGYVFKVLDDLENIYFDGTFADWIQVSLGESCAITNSNIKVYIRDSENNYILLDSIIDNEVVIPGSAKIIGDYILSGYDSIRTVVIEAGVEEIGSGVFYDVSNLEAITIPSTLKHMNGAFIDGENIGINFYYDGNLGDYFDANGNIYGSLMILLPGFKYRDSNNEYLSLTEELVLPGSIEEIKHGMIMTLPIESLVIEEGVNKIEKDAIIYCESLNTVTLPKSLKFVEDSIFTSCYSLDTIYYNGTYRDLQEIVYLQGGYTINVYGLNFYVLNEEGNYVSLYDINVGAITLSDDKTEVLPGEFIGNENITSVVLGNNTTKIGDYAFGYCTGLQSITLPATVKYIGDSAFTECTNLQSIYFDGGLKEWFSMEIVNLGYIPEQLSFYYKGENDSYIKIEGDLIVPGDVLNINSYAFSLYNLSSLTLEDGILNLFENAFSWCNAEYIVLPNTIEYIDRNVSDYYYGEILYDGTFDDMQGIKCEDLRYKLGSLGVYLKQGDTYVSIVDLLEGDIVIPTGVESIGDKEFYACNNITSISIPDTVTIIGSDAFKYCTGLTSIIVPGSVKTIYDNAFSNCESLTSITITAALKMLNYNIISGSSNLSDIYFDGTVTQWLMMPVEGSVPDVRIHIKDAQGDYVLLDDAIPENYVFDNEITEIPANLLNGIRSIKTVTIPVSVQTIGENAFNNCQNLTSVYYEGALSDWLNINFASAECNPMSYVENVYIKDAQGEYVLVSGDLNLARNVSNFAFAGNKLITSVTLLETSTRVGSGAFKDCINISSLTAMYINEFKEYAFAGCSSLATLNLKDGSIAYKEGCFKGCVSLTNVYMRYDGGYSEYIFADCTGITFAEIRGLEYINDGLFMNCTSLTSVLIDKSSLIGSWAFNGCESLEKVYFDGSKQDAEGLYNYIYSPNDEVKAATWYSYSEEEPQEEGNYWHYDENHNVVEW